MSFPAQPPSGRAPRRQIPPGWYAAGALGVAAMAVLLATGRIHVSVFWILVFCAFVPSVILHEVMHGWVAYLFGDPTAKRAGRLTLNPLAHVSLFGTIIVPVVLALSRLPVFGFAKPVPVNPSLMRRPRNEGMICALAGPAVNIVLAVGAGIAFGQVLTPSTKFAVATHLPGVISLSGTPPPNWPATFLFAFGYVNVILAVFNLIPLPPLDGSSVLERFIPRRYLHGYLAIRPYTIFLPLVLVLFRGGQLLSDVFSPFLSSWEHLLGSPFPL